MCAETGPGDFARHDVIGGTITRYVILTALRIGEQLPTMAKSTEVSACNGSRDASQDPDTAAHAVADEALAVLEQREERRTAPLFLFGGAYREAG